MLARDGSARTRARFDYVVTPVSQCGIPSPVVIAKWLRTCKIGVGSWRSPHIKMPTHITDSCIIRFCLPEEQVPTGGTQHPLRQKTPGYLGAAAMKTDFLTIPCPKCGATVGARCRSASGRKMAAAYPHIDRVRVFAERKQVSLPVRRNLRAAGGL